MRRAGRALLASPPPRCRFDRAVRHGGHRLTLARDGTGPARLLDIEPGRSKQVFSSWLAAQTAASRAGIETVTMDGLTGFKTAAAEVLPDAVAVMDPYHVVALAGDAVNRCRQRLQQ